MTPSTVPTIAAPLGFVRPENILHPRNGRPGRRARTVPEPVELHDLSQHVCDIEDLDRSGNVTSLTTHGFESMRVPDRRGLHQRLQAIRELGRLDDTDIRVIRRGLTGARLRSSDGSTLRIVHVAGEGVIFRCAGPDNMELTVPGLADAPGGAAVVHADQDVLGRPVQQITRGLGRRIFRHESIDSQNRRSPLLLVNLWMPLHQPTRPLALMDIRSLDRARDQLHYELPTEGILDREAEDDLNDIWWFRHNPAQRWCFRSAMGLGDAWVFDTLGTPHGAFNVPGETVAAEGSRLVGEAIAAVEAGLPVAVAAPLAVEAAGTAALRGAVGELQAVLDEAARLEDGSGTAWLRRARRAQDAVLRKSIEVRAVVVRLPGRPAGWV